MSLLILETTEWTPHLETGMEIALRARARGQEVHYACLRGLGGFREDRPLKPWRWYKKRDWMQAKNWRALQVLRQHGVHIHAPAPLEAQPPLPEFHDLESLKRYREDGWDLGMGVASSLISLSKCTRQDPGAYPEAVASMVRAGRLIYANVRRLHQQLQPEETVLFNGRFASTRPILRAVQSLGGRWRIHERGCDPDHFYFYDFIPHDMERWSEQVLAESLLQPKTVLEAGAQAYYGRRRSGGAKDWHSFANWRRGDLGVYEKLRAQAPVLYLSSSDDEFAAIGEVLEHAAFPQQMEAVRFVAERCRAAGRLLVVRLHPHLAQKHPAELRYWHENLHGLATIIDAHEKVDTYALIDASSLCVSYGSTAGIEAAYWGKQHLLLGRALYETLPGVIRLRDPRGFDELLRAPPALDREGAIRYGWFMETFGETFRYFKSDGLFGGTFLNQRLDRYLGWLEWWRGGANARQPLARLSHRGAERKP